MEEKLDKKDKDTIVEETDEKEMHVDFYNGEVYDTTEYVPYGVTTFEEYDESVENRKIAEQAKKDAEVYKQLVVEIFRDNDIDTKEALLDLANEFVARTEENVSGENEDKEVADAHPFMVFKGDDGVYRFLTAFSNKWRDQDNPSEIISSKSHERFVKMVDDGETPLPELWLWHIADWKMGDAEVVAFDKETGIAIASGHFIKEAEAIAQLIQENPDDWGVSHGFHSVKRSEEDSTVIVEHITKEISPLPAFAAANKWANFLILKENDMSLTDEKKKQLAESGISEDAISAVEASNSNLAKQLEEAGIESKEENTSEKPVEEVQEEAVAVEEEAPVEEVAEEAGKEKSEDKVVIPVFSEDQTKQLVDAFAQMGEQIAGQVMAQVKEIITPIIDQTKEKQEEIDEFVKQTPALALADELFKTNKSMSATISDSTKLDGRGSLAKDGPAEVKEEGQKIVNTGNPTLDGIVDGLFAPTKQEAD